MFCIRPPQSRAATNGSGKLEKHKPRPLTESEANQVREHGLDPRGMMIEASLPVLHVLTPQDIEELRRQNVDVDKLPSALLVAEPDETAAMERLIARAQSAVSKATPPDLKHAVICMPSFLGMTNAMVPADVISMKTDTVKFVSFGKTYDYSGNYAVMLTKPREHKKPVFGFGSPEKASLVILEEFGDESLPLPNATIWEKTKGFINVVAGDKEWIYSGRYTIQSQ